MNIARLFRLCRKELRETLRDRRTIITLLFMPLLVYPLLSMALNRFLLSAGTPGESGYKIGVSTEAEADFLDLWINSPAAMPPDEVVEASGNKIAEFEILLTGEVDPNDALNSKSVDVAVKVELGATGDPPKITFTSYVGDSVSESARRILVDRLQWFKLSRASRAISKFSPGSLPPVVVEVSEIGEVRSTSMLGTVIPLVLVLMTITGAVYPAIDLTAGERERGTMEALMASPVTRSSVLFAKYVAVVAVAMLTAVANLVAMFTTLWASRLLPFLTGDDGGVPWMSVIKIFGLLILFSGFFSAVLLSLTSFAKSFKEAQAYLIPVMLLSLAPAMVSLLPGVELSGPLAITPLINIVLLTRDVLAGEVDTVASVAAIASTLGYATVAIAVASKLFGSDAVSRTSGQSVGSLLSRPATKSFHPSPQAAATVVALLVPLYFVVSNGLMRFIETGGDSLGMSSRLVLNAIALIGTFGLLPLAVALFNRNDLRSSFRVQSVSAWTLIAVVVMGLGAWVFAHEAFVLADALGIRGMTEEKIAQTKKVVDAWKEVSPVLLVATLAMTPAIIEELCFRGYLFSSLSQVLSPAKTVVLTAVLFGAFHVLTGNALLLERFLPSTLLGLILGWVAYRTGSVVPGMVMHFVHNGLLELAARYEDQLAFLGKGFENQSHLPASWFAVGGTLATIGAILVWASTRRGATAPSDDGTAIAAEPTV
ncbi:MAG: ABC transporter permease subunit/CPBP intramembrane protease [Planctomycetota bacterium]